MQNIPINDSLDVGWKFHNTYSQISEEMISRLLPIPVKSPSIAIFNYELSKELGLNFSSLKNNDLASIFSGNNLPSGSEPIAQAYAGHQFGYFTNLGDGRAIVIGEHIKPDKKIVDIQFKGSGRTPYSRGGDGRAALSPMLREYIISESMHALGIPTTRSLAVVKTGENILRDTLLPGAILTRVATSHIRVGTFQYAAMKKDINALNFLVKFSIDRHYPELNESENSAISLFNKIMEKQIELVVNWMRVGFIHGVMNTDNMTVSGQTIDYGPCAFMDNYNPNTVFSSIDQNGRYSYINQPLITNWNLCRFIETLLPLIDQNENKAIEKATETVNKFKEIYDDKWLNMMRKKIGLLGKKNEDKNLITTLLSLMETNKADFTNTFSALMEKELPKNNLFENKDFINWYGKWKNRLLENNKPVEFSLKLMQNSNPLVIPRNFKVEEVLKEASNNNNLTSFNQFLSILKKPYENNSNINQYKTPPKENNIGYQTYCGT